MNAYRHRYVLNFFSPFSASSPVKVMVFLFPIASYSFREFRLLLAMFFDCQEGRTWLKVFNIKKSQGLFTYTNTSISSRGSMTVSSNKSIAQENELLNMVKFCKSFTPISDRYSAASPPEQQ